MLKRELKKPKPVGDKMMTKTDGSKCKTAEENAEVFRAHFQQLYDRHPVFDPTVIELLAQAPIAA